MPTSDANAPVLDQWSGFSHKAPLSDGTTPAGQLSLAPSWIPPSEQRRLIAYRIARSYLANMARTLLTDQATAKHRREYGDAALIVQRVVAGILGDTTSIVVDGADDDLTEGPDLPEKPADAPADADELTKRIAAALDTEWQRRAEDAVSAWEEHLAAQPDLQARQTWLRQWADDEFLAGKTVDCELDAVGLGDGVYALHPSAEHGRPTLAVHDPGFYFPVLDDHTVGYPRKVHIAWEYEDTTVTPVRRLVRRLTWELVDLTTHHTLASEDGPEWSDGADGTVLVERPGQTITAEGRLVRTYPWHADGQDPSTETCLYSDVTWEWKNLGGRKANDLDLDKALEVTADQVDLGIDFIPVIHIPNTPATREHYGTSTLALIAQILDDLSKSDTDVQAAASIAALPVIALASAANITSDRLVVRSGAVYQLGENGRMDVLDMSRNLTELRASRSELGDRLSVNSQVPAEVTGRAQVNDLSGIAIALRFGPFEQLINFARLTRNPKYRLLLKMLQRIAQTMPGADGQPLLPPGPTPVAYMAFGSFLPSDIGQTVDQVVALLQAHGLSRRSALQLLVDAGVEINDITDELAAIAAEDTEGAVRVADATGSEAAAGKLLGVDPADLPAPAGPASTPTLEVTPPASGGGQ